MAESISVPTLPLRPPSGMGHKPSYYRRSFERLLCEVKQPLIFLPGELLLSATSSHRTTPPQERGFPDVILLIPFVNRLYPLSLSPQ